ADGTANKGGRVGSCLFKIDRTKGESPLVYKKLEC
ncbi:hypothetical protein EZS27_043923, partial [termite gut metagenome]